MKMNKIILGLDLDGNLYDWHDAAFTFYQYELGYEKSYGEFWEEVNLWSKEKQDYLVSLPFLYDCKVPPQSVIDFLNYANEHADDIYYITNRPEELERVTLRYFRRYDFPYPNNLFMTGDKATTCRYLGVTHFLDDHVKHVKAVDGIADAYLMAKPWNREFQEDYKTVHSLKEFQDAIF
jgi:uncharacterized HAD superfamily protein